MILKFNKNHFVLHNKFIIECCSVENIFSLKSVTNYDNFFEKDGHWMIRNKGKDEIFVNILYPSMDTTSLKYKINNTNLLLDNLVIKKKVSDNLELDGFSVIKKGYPYHITAGKFSGQFRNMFWYVSDNNTKEKYYIMDCIDSKGNKQYFKFDKKSLDKVLLIGNKRNVWYIGENGYVATTFKESIDNDTIVRKCRYLHQHLMDHYGNGLKNGVMSVDHINTDKLDNRLDNLRLVDQSEQNKNRSKRKRQKSAKCDLPDFIEELPKYVQYIDSRGGYFCIRNHPNYPDEYYQSTTRKDVSLQEKYQSTLNKLKEYNDKNINNNIDNKTADSNTGIKYITKTTLHGNECYYFDTKLDGSRYTKKKSNISIKDFQQLVLASFPDIRKNLEQEWNIKLITNENDTEKTIDYYKSKLPKYFSLYQEKKRNKDEYVWIISYNRKENDKRITFRKTLPKLNDSHVTIAIDLLNNKINK